jgi:hypothetical protein
MQRDEFIFQAIVQLLKHPQKKSILSTLAQWYEVEKTQAVGKVSIAAWKDGAWRYLKDWSTQLAVDLEGIQVTTFHPDTQGLEPHIAAAFAGNFPFLLQVKTQGVWNSYQLNTYHSRNNALNGKELAQLLTSQVNQASARDCWHRIISEHLELNNRSAYQSPDIVTFFHSEEDMDTVDFLMGNLITELQIQIAVDEQEFIIPKELSSKLYQQDDQLTSFFGEDIPYEFNTGNPIEDKKANLRASSKFKKWYPESNNEVWEMYGLVPLDYPFQAASMDHSKDFISALQQIGWLAQKIESRNTNNLLLASTIAKCDTTTASFTTQSKQRWKEVCTADQSLKLDEILSPMEDYYLSAAFTEQQVWGILLLELTNIFGGMGSWNDIYLEDESLRKEYDEISQRFYQERMLFQLDVLNG